MNQHLEDSLYRRDFIDALQEHLKLKPNQPKIATEIKKCWFSKQSIIYTRVYYLGKIHELQSKPTTDILATSKSELNKAGQLLLQLNGSEDTKFNSYIADFEDNQLVVSWYIYQRNFHSNVRLKYNQEHEEFMARVRELELI
jgi:hypothetical protein